MIKFSEKQIRIIAENDLGLNVLFEDQKVISIELEYYSDLTKKIYKHRQAFPIPEIYYSGFHEYFDSIFQNMIMEICINKGS